jgi:hypothetical protein
MATATATEPEITMVPEAKTPARPLNWVKINLAPPMESDETHVPGPYTLDLHDAHDRMPYFRIEGGCGYFDTSREKKGLSITGIMSEADARLWTAAPELLAALEDMVKSFGYTDWDSVHDAARCDYARSIIRKATGRYA